MTPLADVHCHLLAGLDDGPQTAEEAREMCRAAHADGVRHVAATAHFNPLWRNRPEQIREAAARLREDLRAEGIELQVYPSTEVAVFPELLGEWDAGGLLGFGGRTEYLLIELPHRVYFDLTGLVGALVARGTRPVLAHVERYPDLLHGGGRVEGLIAAGCLIQVNAGGVTDPAGREERRILRDWVRRGVVHVLGSDGHSLRKRPPLMSAAWREVRRWAGEPAADRIGGIHGLAILQGLPLRPPPPEPRRKGWFSLG